MAARPNGGDCRLQQRACLLSTPTRGAGVGGVNLSYGPQPIDASTQKLEIPTISENLQLKRVYLGQREFDPPNTFDTTHNFDEPPPPSHRLGFQKGQASPLIKDEVS